MNNIIAKLEALCKEARDLRPAYSPAAAYHNVSEGYGLYSDALRHLNRAAIAFKEARRLLGLQED